MSWRKRAGGYKRDIAEPSIIEALERVGARCWRLNGKGCPDILVLFHGVFFPAEVKTGKRKPTENQDDIPWPIWRTPEEALAGIGALARDECEWPACARPAFCRSGNFGGRLVCRVHFRVTNGSIQ